MNKTKYVISDLVYAIERSKDVLLCNTSNSLTQELPKECYRAIKEYLPDYYVDDICEASHEDDREYFREMFDYLIKKEFLIEQGKSYIKNIEIVVTNRCNLKCRHCCADAFDACCEDHLTIEDIKKIIDSAERLNVKSIVITGGEPMLRKDFFEIVDYLKEHFSGHCNLMTNGMFINEKNVDKLISCFEGFNISLDGYDEETCSKIRGAGVFGKVISNIEMLKQHGMPAKRIAVSMVETSYTYQNKDKFIKLNEKMGTKPVVREFSPIGRGEKTKDEFVVKDEKIRTILSPDEMLKIISDEKKKRNTDKEENDYHERLSCRSCAAGEQSFVVNYDGNIYPCVLLDKPKYSFGSIKDIEELDRFLLLGLYKETEGYRNFSAILPKNHPKCSSCDYSPFCIYCYASFERFNNSKDFGTLCKIKQSELCQLWR